MEISSRWPKFTLNRHDIGDYGVNGTGSLHWCVGGSVP